MEEYLTQLTDYLITQSWHIALLVIVIAGASWLLKNRSAHVRYLLWLIVLAKCLVPPLLTVPLAILPQEEPVLLLERLAPVTTEPVASAPVPDASPPPPEVVQARTALAARQWLALAWVAGLVAFLLFAVAKAARTNRWLRRQRRPMPADVQSHIQRLFSDLTLGAFPKLWLIDGIGQPFVWGLLRGSIYLPAGFAKIEDAGHRRGILGHELSHVVRFDAAVNLLQIIVQAVFWFHPLVWWANKKIRAEREKCCDEMAIARLGAKVRDYSTAIVNTLIAEHESTRPVPSLAIAGPVKNIEERIKTIMKPGRKFYKNPTVLAVITVLFLAILAVPTTLALTKRELESDTSTTQPSNLEVLDIKFEPIRQGKNVVHVKVQNTSDEEQMFRVHIYTRSPDYGRSGVGWGTPFFETVKPKETKWTRFAFKIQGPVTDGTYIRLTFHNPGPAETFDKEKWWAQNKDRQTHFKKTTYKSSQLKKYEADGKPPTRALKEYDEAIIAAFRQIQHHIENEKYEQAWKLFSEDYQKAEFQTGFERFKKAMEPVHLTDSGFVWEKDDFLSLQPAAVVERDGVLSLAATCEDQSWRIDFVQEDGQWKIDWIAGYTPAIIRMQLAEEQRRFESARNVQLEILDIKFEPIRQGKNVVRVKVKNTSDRDQTLGIDIRAESSTINWQTQFLDTIKGHETRWTRFAFKIYDPITDATSIRLRFYNPTSADEFDIDKWFKRIKYFAGDLEHYRLDKSLIKAASEDEADAVITTLRKIQDHIKNKEYESAWQLFTQDFREAEFQRRGFEWFKECMEKPQNFYLSRTELLALQPKSVDIRNGIFTLTAAMRDEYRKVDLLKVDGKWKIDSIEQVILSALEVLDVKFEPIRQGKNVVRLKVRNSSGKDQTFGVDIRAEAPIRNWQSQFLDTIKGSETKSKSFDFEILGPITDAISIRLRFYNPPSADEFDINNWFKRIRYTYKDLDRLGILQERLEPASKSQAEAVANTFRQFQSYLKEQKYDAVWGLLTKHIRSAQFQDDFEKFKEQFSGDPIRTLFLNLRPESVTKSGKFLTLSAKDAEQTWKMHFIKEDGQWKIYGGEEPDRSDWQERLLPNMQKRVTKHFDIYYFKDSTAEKEIEQIAERKEKGFQQICQFLGKDSDVRIRMVLFEDGRTKQRQTGHQGAGWAFGNTIVEVYNENEKLDPYHETTHVLMRPFGNPPALFNEGFAVYMSERLGAHALKSLGGGLATIHQRVKELKQKHEWIDLAELITYTEIGSRRTRPPVSYAEAASFVKFLIDNHGKDKFLQAYITLKNSDDKGVHRRNREKLADIYGKSLQQLERQWHDTLAASPSTNSILQGMSEKAKAAIRVEARFLLIPVDAQEFKELLERENLESSHVKGDPNSRSYFLNAEQVEQLWESVRLIGECRVLMAPTLEVVDGETATIRGTTETKYISGYSEPTLPSEKPEPIQDSVETGEWLQVKPKLQPDGQDILAMDLDFEISSITGYEKFVYKEKYPYEIPIIEKVGVSAQYTVAAGQTLLLCGRKMTEKQHGRTEQKGLLILIKAEQIVAEGA